LYHNCFFVTGGIFGFIRATSGPYLGFCVGCCETLQYVSYAADVAMVLGNAVSVSLGVSSSIESVFAIIFLIFAAAINIRGGKLFWQFNYLIAILSIALLLLYIITTISGVNYIKYVANVQNTSSFNGHTMMEYFPTSMWFFLGSETLPLYGRSTANVCIKLPLLNFHCFLLFFLSFLLFLFSPNELYQQL